ncbi:MAG: hypothetical protein WBN92_13010 [Terriglobia bacterium]
MRLIIDSNQISRFPNSNDLSKFAGKCDGITLAPYVLAEVIISEKHTQYLSRIRGFDVKLGLEPEYVGEIVAGLSKDQISTFEPFLERTHHFYVDYERAMRDPSPDDIASAKRRKDRSLEICVALRDAAKEYRRLAQKDEGVRHLRFHNMEEALSSEFGRGNDSFLSLHVSSFISAASTRPVVESNELLNVVMCNQFLRRFFMTFFYYSLAMFHLWEEQRGNVDPREYRDDWTDLSLPLYAKDGDIIVSEDRLLRKAIKMVEPQGSISVKSWKEMQQCFNI